MSHVTSTSDGSVADDIDVFVAIDFIGKRVRVLASAYMIVG